MEEIQVTEDGSVHEHTPYSTVSEDKFVAEYVSLTEYDCSEYGSVTE